MELKKVLDAIKQDLLYDFVARHYNELTKEELKDLVLELSYALYVHKLSDNVILEELTERWENII